jgi:glycosyltransferase involved in cell wall biosynthesis
MRGGVPARVLIFCEQFHPVVGGRERQAQLLAATLVSQGTVAEVLTFRSEPEWPATEILPGDVIVRRIPDVDFNRRFPRVRRVGLGLLTVLLRAFRTASAVRAAARRFDVIHVHNVSSPFTAFAVRRARRLGLRTVATAVNIGEWFDLDLLSKYRHLGQRCVHWLVQDVDRWVAISMAVARELRIAGIPEERITHLPNGVSLAEIPVELPVSASHFLHIGRLATTAPRDVLGLLQAFELVARRSEAAELALVGGGDHLHFVRRAAAASPVGERIHVPGTDNGAHWRRWAHCLVQPSFSEGMSNALLEGMASGLACVAYDIPPNREALGDAGVLVPVADRSALARVLSELVTVDGLAQGWGRRARQRAERMYDIHDIARRTIELYEVLTSGAA